MFWDPRGDVLSGPRTSALGTRASKISVVYAEIETGISIALAWSTPRPGNYFK
jgi:hypothetical protein